VKAMYEQRLLIDLSHMSERSVADTFDLLDRLDAESGAAPADHPVIATHAGYRFGDQEYMLSAATIRKIAARDGVIGLIMARHQLNDGDVNPDPDDPASTPAVLRRHIDAIRETLGATTNDHVAIGSDLDGFIKPTMAGIETAADLRSLEAPLRAAYGDAEAILSGNALRVARWALG
jgi:microsomal dipeptidase-like Zn-dependent dipeptidase